MGRGELSFIRKCSTCGGKVSLGKQSQAVPACQDRGVPGSMHSHTLPKAGRMHGGGRKGRGRFGVGGGKG